MYIFLLELGFLEEIRTVFLNSTRRTVTTLLASFSVPWAHIFLLNVPTFFLQATLKSSLIHLQHYLLQVLITFKE